MENRKNYSYHSMIFIPNYFTFSITFPFKFSDSNVILSPSMVAIKLTGLSAKTAGVIATVVSSLIS